MNKFLFLLSVLFLISCSVAPRYSSGSSKSNKSNGNKSSPRYSSTSAKKNPTNSNLSTSNIKDHKLEGISSWYGPNFHGKLTANGEVYDMYGVTAAHKTLPLNTICRVTNLANDKSLILRINDRGPYIKGRILDCSYGAAKKLDFINQGTTKVQIDVIEWGDGVYMHHRKLSK